MDLKQLQYFVACAQTGSFSDAAKLLYSTQPSVSKVIKALESSMGIVLFDRMPRGIALTTKGPPDCAGKEGLSLCLQDHKRDGRTGKHGCQRNDQVDSYFDESQFLACKSVCGFL